MDTHFVTANGTIIDKVTNYPTWLVWQWLLDMGNGFLADCDWNASNGKELHEFVENDLVERSNNNFGSSLAEDLLVDALDKVHWDDICGELARTGYMKIR